MLESQLTTSTGFATLLADTHHAADHLEMRDWYAAGDSMFDVWRRAGDVPTDPDDPYWRGWTRTVRDAVARGVRFRRLRVVSEPLSAYTRYEHATAPVNIAAGEDVRWLPRRLASDLLLPGNDGWIFDGRTARFHMFDGDGHPVGNVECGDPVAATRAAAAFEAAWERAIPHAEYDPDGAPG